MQKIALIQNQGYMSYSSKSDVRPLLVNLGYESEKIKLYTAHNIGKLRNDLRDGEIEAVIFTSNSLSDYTIKAEVESEGFKRNFTTFLNKGKGCLILHQLNLASQSSSEPGGTFNFLPMKSPKAVKREEEDKTQGDFKKTRFSEGHALFHYPNNVAVEELKQYCIQKKGLYWHYLDDVDSAEWDVLLHDEGVNQVRRPLLIATRESAKQRVVISSLNLDWQKEEVLLKNLLTYIEKGKCNTAIIKDDSINSMAFEFFLKTLDAQSYRYQEYNLSSGLVEFKNQVEQGTHSIVVLGPTNLDDGNEEKRELVKEIEEFLNSHINDGKIKYIGIQPDEKNIKHFFVAGREKFALRILQDTKIKIHRILQQKKLIDDSFWSSVDTLKVLKGIEGNLKTFPIDTVKPIIDKAKGKVSYDGLLVPTSALLWMRASYLGVEKEQCKETIQWMKNALLSNEEVEVECILAYNTFLELQIETEFAAEQLKRLIYNKDLSDYNEIEIVHYLKAAILLKDIDHIKLFINTLESKRNQELLWIDLSISATIVNLLLEALVMLKENDEVTTSIEEMIEEMVFPTVIIMQKMTTKDEVEDGIQFHWDNKANTTLKCVSAMLKFEELMDLPVTEMVQSLLSYTQTGIQVVDNHTALSVIEEFKEDHSILKTRVQEIESINKQLMAEKVKFEKENQQLIATNNDFKRRIDSYDDERLKNDQKLTYWNYLLPSAIVLLIVAILTVIFFANNREAYKILKDYYPLPMLYTVISIIFTGIFGFLTKLPRQRNRGVNL